MGKIKPGLVSCLIEPSVVVPAALFTVLTAFTAFVIKTTGTVPSESFAQSCKKSSLNQMVDARGGRSLDQTALYCPQKDLWGVRIPTNNQTFDNLDRLVSQWSVESQEVTTSNLKDALGKYALRVKQALNLADLFPDQSDAILSYVLPSVYNMAGGERVNIPLTPESRRAYIERMMPIIFQEGGSITCDSYSYLFHFNGKPINGATIHKDNIAYLVYSSRDPLDRSQTLGWTVATIYDSELNVEFKPGGYWGPIPTPTSRISSSNSPSVSSGPSGSSGSQVEDKYTKDSYGTFSPESEYEMSPVDAGNLELKVLNTVLKKSIHRKKDQHGGAGFEEEAGRKLYVHYTVRNRSILTMLVSQGDIKLRLGDILLNPEENTESSVSLTPNAVLSRTNSYEVTNYRGFPEADLMKSTRSPYDDENVVRHPGGHARITLSLELGN